MSSGSDSDEDFVPGEPEKLSEEESADEETDLQFENELEKKSRKRKASSEQKGIGHRKSKKVEDEEQNSIEEKEELSASNPKDEKKRSDDLWAKFLEGTDTKPKPKSDDKGIKVPTKAALKEDVTKKVTEKKKEDVDSKERKIFEFAGETIVVEDNIIKETIKIDKSKPTVSPSVAVPKSIPGRSNRSSGGLSGVLGQLNRKSTLSTLDKSKFDWDTYKKEEGIEEEVKQINKGKDGYLDKQDFLERADHRQYELERDMRTTTRRTTR